MKKVITLLSILLLASCAEEVLTAKSKQTATTINTQSVNQLEACSQMQLDKPPVDILYVVDNSGSTNLLSFSNLKSEISNTISSISNDFNYHVYVAPLIPQSSSEPKTNYPLIVSGEEFPSSGTLNIQSVSSLSSNIFQTATGNNAEHGFSRAYELIQANRENGIFREGANLIIVMISNGDDNSAVTSLYGNQIVNQNVISQHQLNFQSLTKKYSDMNPLMPNLLKAESLRFISLVAHSNCNGQTKGQQYINMSSTLYNYMGYTDDPTKQNSRDLCTDSPSSLFSVVNSSIQSVVTGHKYDAWLISNQTDSTTIQTDDITLTKVLANGSQVAVPASTTNGFEFIGAQTSYNTRYFPTEGAPVSGLVVKLYGDARVTYPECLIAKTVSPIEYFGYAVLPQEPIESTILVYKNGVQVPQSATNGWSYLGFRDNQNTKIEYSNQSSQPGVFRSGYFIRLTGDAILTNGDTVDFDYTAAPIN